MSSTTDRYKTGWNEGGVHIAHPGMPKHARTPSTKNIRYRLKHVCMFRQGNWVLPSQSGALLQIGRCMGGLEQKIAPGKQVGRDGGYYKKLI